MATKSKSTEVTKSKSPKAGMLSTKPVVKTKSKTSVTPTAKKRGRKPRSEMTDDLDSQFSIRISSADLATIRQASKDLHLPISSLTRFAIFAIINEYKKKQAGIPSATSFLP